MKRTIQALWNLSPTRALLALLLFALFVRTAVMIVTWDHLRQDPDHYARLAQNLAEHGSFSFYPPQPTAFRPPLYPLLLSTVSGPDGPRPMGVAVLHVLLGVLTVAAVTLCGRQMKLGSAALLAGAIVALDPILLYQSSFVMTETLATALVAVTLYVLAVVSARPSTSVLLTAGRIAAAGLLLGLASLARPTFLIWIPAVGAGIVLLKCHDHERRYFRWMMSGILLASSAIPVSVWTLRNWREMGAVIATTTHGGYTLWLANNELYYDFVEKASWRFVWDSQSLDEMRLEAARTVDFDERAADRHDYGEALATMRQRPGTFVRSCFVRLAEFWNPLPHAVDPRATAAHTLARWLIAVWYVALYAVCILGLWRLGRDVWRAPWCWGWSLVLLLTLVHLVYWSNMRMRAPVIPVLAMLAARGLVVSNDRK